MIGYLLGFCKRPYPECEALPPRLLIATEVHCAIVHPNDIDTKWLKLHSKTVAQTFDGGFSGKIPTTKWFVRHSSCGSEIDNAPQPAAAHDWDDELTALFRRR